MSRWSFQNHCPDRNAYTVDLPSSYGVSPTFNIGDLAPYYTDLELRAIPFQEGGIEPNHLGLEEGSNNDSRTPRNNNNKGNNITKNNRNHIDVSEVLSDDSEFTHTRPSSMNNDEFNASQNNQEKGKLTMKKQIQELETSKHKEGQQKQQDQIYRRF